MSGTPDNKRKAEEAPKDGSATGADGADGAKRPRLAAAAAAAPPPPPAAAPRPAADVLEKAKRAVAAQAGLKEKLAKMKEARAAAAAAAAVAAMPAPPPAARPGMPPPRAPRAAPLALERAPQLDQAAPHFDPALGTREAARLVRRPRAELRFVAGGAYEKEAATQRLRAEFGDDYIRDLEARRRREAASAAAAAAAGQADPNQVPIGERAGGAGGAGDTGGEGGAEAEAPEPEVEWWDARLLKDRSSYGAAAAGGAPALREGRVTALVEHPVPLPPPAEAPPPPPQPLRLTARELKKLRTQRREAREAEKRELVRQGLLEPPPPRVRLANLMRVLGAEAAADPTAVEGEVRRQVAERAAAHEDRNLARALTPAERREKKLRKLLDHAPPGAEGDADGGDGAPAGPAETLVAVYKVGSLAAPRLRFKVVMNAKENRVSGAALAPADAFALVIVEGGPKTLRRYEALMTRRIKWAEESADADGADGDAMDAEGGGGGAPGGTGVPGGGPNYCHLVWRGVVAEPSFRGRFRCMDLPSAAAARRVLEDRGLAHYWDLAAAFAAE
jgi:U4/U6 small nuclear ribonucleoprotein PRP3